jgi:hypothetical protein
MGHFKHFHLIKINLINLNFIIIVMKYHFKKLINLNSVNKFMELNFLKFNFTNFKVHFKYLIIPNYIDFDSINFL